MSHSESLAIAEAAEAVETARKAVEFACLERDRAVQQLATVLQLGEIDQKVIVIGDTIFDVGRRHNVYRCTVIKANRTLPF